MKRILIIAAATGLLLACKDGDKKVFKVAGKITNATGKMVYLEEVPIGTMRPVIIDSATLAADGSFSIETETGEAAIYNIRIDQGRFPVASVINDQPAVDLDLVLSQGQGQGQFPEKYEVKGSPASQKMKDFMVDFNEKVQQLVMEATQLDSLHGRKTPDSVIAALAQTHTTHAEAVKTYSVQEMRAAGNPALTMFILGYYQSTASNPGLGLEPLSNEQVSATISDLIQKNPGHTGMVALQKDLQAQLDQATKGALVGKPAPEFTLPDANGQPVALSSFKGKYVLLDFWASWCKPCRVENPNVVQAFHKFKDKNFTVVGVSLDRSREPWLKAIKDDQLAWPQLSDLQFWESPVVGLYGFEGIPFNVLIDPQGSIIAEGLRGRFLESKLKEVLQ